MGRGWLYRSVVAVVLVVGVPGAAVAQEKSKLSDQLIEQLATGLTRIAEAGSARMAAYFTAEPTAEVRAYLEGQGVEVIVAAAAAPAPAGPPPVPMGASPMPPAPGFTTMPAPGSAPGPYGMMGMRVPESKKMIQDFLTGVRELASNLPADSPLAIDVFTVDLPGGSITFRLR
jgi:hypothetical protein